MASDNSSWSIVKKYKNAFDKEKEDPNKALPRYREMSGTPPASIKGKIAMRIVTGLLVVCVIAGIITSSYLDSIGEMHEDYFFTCFLYSFLSAICFGVPAFGISAYVLFVSKSDWVPARMSFEGLATLGMARCAISGGRWGEARGYATQLMSYPLDSMKKAGEAILSFLDGNPQNARNHLDAGRSYPHMKGKALSCYYSALDRCSSVFDQRAQDIPGARAPQGMGAQGSREEVHYHQVVVQNIGEYVAGGKVDLQDCVVNRSDIGNVSRSPSAEVQDMKDRSAVLVEYRKLLESAWEDGVVTDEEFEFLQRVRKTEGITLAEHLKAEEEVKARMVSKQSSEYPCPDCNSALQYVEEYEKWYCWKCGDYKY